MLQEREANRSGLQTLNCTVESPCQAVSSVDESPRTTDNGVKSRICLPTQAASQLPN